MIQGIQNISDLVKELDLVLIVQFQTNIEYGPYPWAIKNLCKFGIIANVAIIAYT